MVNYRFNARDLDVGIDLSMYCQLSYSPSTSFSTDGLSAKFILGEFGAADIAKQAYDWFIGQHNVKIDQSSFFEFLDMIQKYTSTPFIAVCLDLEKDDSIN